MSQIQSNSGEVFGQEGDELLKGLLDAPLSAQGTTIVEQLTKAEIDVQIATAKKYPRSLEKFAKDAMTMATSNVGVAASCFYSVPRDGKSITGPSIRLAEIIASCWGNIRVDCRIVDVGEEAVVARASVHDLERNVLTALEVRRRITTKNGKRYSEDMIGVTAMAALSIARRNAIFSVIPMGFAEPILAAARSTAVGDQKTIADRRAAMLAAWLKMGVENSLVFANLGIRGEADISLEHIERMIGLFNAVREGSLKIEEAFPPSAEQKKTASERLEEQRKQNAAPKAEEPKTEAKKPEQKPTETPAPGTWE